MDWWVAAYCFIASIIFLTIVFFIAQRKDRYDLIDAGWGMAFITITAVSYLARPSYELFSVSSLVALLVIIWGMRLSLHIYQRWEQSSKEDKRYAEVRAKYKNAFGGVAFNMYIKVYLAQAILAWIICLPVILVTTLHLYPSSYGLVAIGFIVWLVGYYFEVVGDAQLASFAKDSRNKGKIMTSGLWRYTRHPNYFGEAVQWWGIFIITLVAPYGWMGIIGPLTISCLLLFISGVPLAEKHLEGRSGWLAYKRRTSKFIPLLPRH